MFIELQNGTLYNISNCRKIDFKQNGNMNYTIEFLFDDVTSLTLEYYSEDSLFKARRNLIKYMKENRAVINYGDLINNA